MAIGDLPSSPPRLHPIDIEAWTEQATVSLGAVTIATPSHVLSGHSATLAIPLDDHVAPAAPTHPVGAVAAATQGSHYRRKEPVRRDSMKSREALLKGKEGSRRRQRWENDRLLNNPHVTPPLPRDWEVHPTHPSKPVPYALAPLWDAGLAHQSAARKTASHTSSKTKASHHTSQHAVPKELRDKLKHSRSAKGLLMHLEAQVRSFIAEWAAREQRAAAAVARGLPADLDSEDDEIVFVGRNGAMNDRLSEEDEEGSSSSSSSSVDTALGAAGRSELMLLETAEGEVGGAFGRWLVHQIGVYYGLQTWSVTVGGSPARRQAYVGVKGAKLRAGNLASIY